MQKQDLILFEEALLVLNELYGRMMGTEQEHANARSQFKVISFDNFKEISQKKKEELGNRVDFISQTTKEAEKLLKIYRKAIFRSKSNSWELRYRRNGVEVSFTALTQDECKKKFDFWLKENQVKTTKKESSTMTVESWYNQWLTVYKTAKVKPASLKTINYLLQKNMIKIIGDKDIKKVTNMELQNLIYSMDAEGNSRHKLKTYLKDIFKQAYNNKIIKENPAVELNDNSLPYKEGVGLTHEEQGQLLDYPEESLLKKYYIFTLLTGCRRSESLKFAIEDIDGDKLHINGTKTSGSNRFIPLFSDIKELLKTIDVKSGKLFNFKADYVTRNAKTFLPNGHTIKDLRTTFATNCNEKGIDTKVIQKWMGHSSDTMTKKRYIKVLDEYEQSELGKMTPIFPQIFPKNSKK